MTDSEARDAARRAKASMDNLRSAYAKVTESAPVVSDREEFQAARDAGLKQRHEQRLARSAHYNEAVKAAAVAIGRAFNGDPLTWRAEAEAAVDAALPHLRAYQIEVQTRIGFALGRKEAAEEIATVAEEYADDLEPPTTCEWLELRDWFKGQLHEVAAKAREIGTKEAS